jgi:hypothetical protein
MLTMAEWPPRLDNGDMEEAVLIQKAQIYASQNQLELTERLGFGIHGIIFAAKDKLEGGERAVKVHREPEPYVRERAAYERLKQARIIKILGFNVPQFISADDTLRVIEMSIVKRPFALDFAGAYLNAPPDFPDEIWAEWETEKREQFGAHWAKVQAVLAALEELDIHMVDVSPSNIAFPA